MSFAVYQNFHDAELKSIDNEKSGQIVLLFRTPDGGSKSITLEGVRFFRLSDFVTQNVVSRLLIFRGPDIDIPEVSERLKWATSRSDMDSFLSDEKLIETITEIQTSEYGLLVIEPSWGAELVVLFKEIH